MTDHDELETRWPRVVARFVWWGVVAVVLYVLSPGPMLMARGRSERVDSLLTLFYAPLHELVVRTPLGRQLSPYYGWWAELPGGIHERNRLRMERAQPRQEQAGPPAQSGEPVP